MAMQASTLDILVEKAHFELKVARAVGEAIDNELHASQFVTVPVLDVRLGALRSDLRVEIHDAVVGLERRMYAAIVGQLAVLLGIAYFFTTHWVK